MVEQESKVYKQKETQNINILPGDHNRSPDESFNSTFVFLDGGFVSKLGQHFGEGKFLIYDIHKFSQNLAKKQHLNCQQIFYYTAPPFQSNNPTKEQEHKKEGYDKFIKKLKEKRIIVREGRCQRLIIDGKESFNQKAVDILLAIDLMNIPLQHTTIKKVILLTADSDFVPVIKELEKHNIKTILYTFYSKNRNMAFSRSNHLIKSVHKYAILSKEDFINSPLFKKQDN